MDLASGHIAALRKLEAEHLKWKVRVLICEKIQIHAFIFILLTEFFNF